MLVLHSPYTQGLWSGTCSACLKAIPLTEGTRVEAEEKLQELGWEVRSPVSIWCADCLSKARAPKLGLTPRGQRRRRP